MTQGREGDERHFEGVAGAVEVVRDGRRGDREVGIRRGVIPIAMLHLPIAKEHGSKKKDSQLRAIPCQHA